MDDFEILQLKNLGNLNRAKNKKAALFCSFKVYNM